MWFSGHATDTRLENGLESRRRRRCMACERFKTLESIQISSPAQESGGERILSRKITIK